MESKHFLEMPNFLSETGDFPRCRILRADLKRDHFEVLISFSAGWQPGKGSLSGQLEELIRSGAVHPEDAERFTAFFTPECLLSREGQPSLFYRRRAGADFRWRLVEVIPDSDGLEGTAVLYARDADGLPREILEEATLSAHQQELARAKRDIQIASVLKSRFKIINTVDLENGQCRRMDLTRSDGREDTLIGDYSAFIQKALDSYVHPDDAEEYWSLLCLDHLREKAAATEDFAEEVCCYRQRGETTRWIELRIIYSRKQDQQMVNILGQDITKLKQQEESRREAMADRTHIISSLSSLFFSTYYIDLEQDTFRTVTQLRQVGDVLGSEVNFTAALSIYANHFIHPDDREEYLNVMSVQNLRDRLRWWDPYVAVEYRRLPEGPEASQDQCQWVRAAVVLARTGGDDLPRSAVYVAQEMTGSGRRGNIPGSGA